MKKKVEQLLNKDQNYYLNINMLKMYKNKQTKIFNSNHLKQNNFQNNLNK